MKMPKLKIYKNVNIEKNTKLKYVGIIKKRA